MEDFLKDFETTVPKRFCEDCNIVECKIPQSPWDEIIKGCRLEGWMFQQREFIKQKIRKQKEALLSLTILQETVSKEQREEIKEKIENIKKEIEIFSQFGSWDW